MGERSGLLDGFGDDFAWSLFDAAPDAVFVVADTGEIAFASNQAADLFRAATTELVGLSVDELLPEDLRTRHRAHRTRYRAQPEVRLMGVGLQLTAQRRDGSQFFAEISLSPLDLGGQQFVVAAVRDISDRVAAEDHLHRVLATLDASDDAIFMFDADTLRYAHVNDGATRLVGYSKDELLAMTPMHLNASKNEGSYRELVAHLLARPGETVRHETRMIRKDGLEVPVEKTFQAATEARDGTRWIVILARDITARLEAEEQLRASQEALQAAQQAVMLADDRDRIARDLHDTVIQRLFAAGLTLQALAATTEERIRSKLELTVDDLDETIRELRAAIFSLQARQALAGLRGRLLDVVTDAAPALRAEPRIQFDGPIDSLSERIAEHLVPTLREALSNIAHHADAKTVRVILTVADDVHLQVIDDGVGTTGDVVGGHGLANMVRRAEKLEGTASIGPAPGGGTILDWRVPRDQD